MQSLIQWKSQNTIVNPIVKTAAFVYEFLSIHPFQDGNGRLSRLLTTLVLLQNGYKWIEYVSFEHEIEKNRKKYYQALRNCQAKRPNEEITMWVDFFIQSLLNLIQKLKSKFELVQSDLTTNQKNVYIFISNNPQSKSDQIINATDIPRATLKRILLALLDNNLIDKNSNGAATTYRMKTRI